MEALAGLERQYRAKKNFQKDQILQVLTTYLGKLWRGNSITVAAVGFIC